MSQRPMTEKEIVDRIDNESRSHRYPSNKPFFDLRESANPQNIEVLKAYIPTLTDAQEKSEAYGALGFVGRICQVDQSNYILDELLKENDPEVIDKTLSNFNGSQVPILNRLETLKNWLASKKKGVRQSAITAMVLCEPEWPEAEQLLIRHFAETKNKYDLFYIAFALEERGSVACLPTLKDAIENKKITDGDGVCFVLRAAKRIAPASMTSVFVYVLNNVQDTFLKKEAIDGLVAGADISALEAVLERPEKILAKNHSKYMIDYGDDHSELQAALTYLKLFADKDSRVPQLFEWIKAKKMHYMDGPTRQWAEKNL